MMPTSGDSSDAFDNVAAGAVFQEISHGAEVDGFVEDAFSVMHGQENNTDRQIVTLNFARDLDPFHLRHVHVEHGDIGPQLLNQFECRTSVTRFTKNLEAVFQLNDLTQTL